MSAVIIDGKKVAEQIKSELLERIQTLKDKCVTPGLATVLVGNDPASKIYIASKTRMCETLGIYSKHWRLEESTSESDLISLVKRLNDNPQIPRDTRSNAITVANLFGSNTRNDQLR